MPRAQQGKCRTSGDETEAAMTRADLIHILMNTELEEQHRNLTREQARAVVNEIFEAIKDALRKGEDANLPFGSAGSTGRCNTGLQFTRRSLKAQVLSRALIEAQRDLVEMGLRVDGQVGFLWEVLS